MTYYIKADKFFYPYHTRNGGYLEIKEGKFGKHRQEVPQDAEVKDIQDTGLLQDWWIHIYMVSMVRM